MYLRNRDFRVKYIESRRSGNANNAEWARAGTAARATQRSVRRWSAQTAIDSGELVSLLQEEKAALVALPGSGEPALGKAWKQVIGKLLRSIDGVLNLLGAM